MMSRSYGGGIGADPFFFGFGFCGFIRTGEEKEKEKSDRNKHCPFI